MCGCEVGILCGCDGECRRGTMAHFVKLTRDSLF